jgi:hypothetical protein
MVVVGEGRLGKQINDHVSMVVLPFPCRNGLSLGQVGLDLGDLGNLGPNVGPKPPHGIPMPKPDMIGVMHSIDNRLAVGDDVGKIPFLQLIHSHDDSDMLRGHRRLRKPLRQRVLQSPEDRL